MMMKRESLTLNDMLTTEKDNNGTAVLVTGQSRAHSQHGALPCDWVMNGIGVMQI